MEDERLRYLVRPVHWREADGTKPMILCVFDLDTPMFRPRDTDGVPTLEPQWVFRWKPVGGRSWLGAHLETLGVPPGDVLVQADAVVSPGEGRRLQARAIA